MELPTGKNKASADKGGGFSFSGADGRGLAEGNRKLWTPLNKREGGIAVQPTPRRRTRAAGVCEDLSAALSVLIFISACLVLAGWVWDVPALKSVLPGFVSMKANTALGFMLLGLSLWLLQAKRSDRVLNRRIARGCSLAVFLIGTLTVIEYTTRLDFGIDQCIVRSAGDVLMAAFPGRMAINSAANFIFAGSAFFLMTWRNPRYSTAAQFLLIPLGALSLLSLTGYLYGAQPFFLVGRYSTAEALHTVVLFLAVFLGGMLCRTDSGFARHLTSDRIGGRFLRWILPLAILIPLFLAWLKVRAEDMGFLPPRFGVTFVAVANLLAASTYIFVMGIFLNRRDARGQAAQQALEISERSYRTLFETAKDGILILDGETGEIVDSNPFLWEITGYSFDEMFGKKLWEAGFLKGKSFGEGAFAEMKDKEYFRHENLLLQKKSGDEMLVEVVSTTYEVEGVKIIQCNIRDITDRIVVQRTLREMEEKYRQLFESVKNCIVIYRAVDNGEDFLISNINLSAERLEGVNKEAVVGSSILQVFPGVREFGLLEVLKRVYRTGKPEQFPAAFYHDNRVSGWRENYVFKLPEDNIVVVYEDVTDRKRAEEGIRKAAEEWQRTFDSISDMVFLMDKDCRLTKVNLAVCKLFGKSSEELLGSKCFELVHHKDSPWPNCPFQKMLKDGTAQCEEAEGPNGVPLLVTVSPILGAQGEVLGAVHIATDITGQKKVERELKDSRDHLEKIINSVADPIFVKDREHRWTLVNEAFCRFMGRSRELLIGKSDYDFFSKAEADIFWKKDEEVFGSGTTNINEEELTDAQGAVHTVVTKKTLWKDARGEAWIVGVVRDMTDFRKLERDLRQQRDHLDELVVERTISLEETNQKLFETALQLAKAGKAKSDFLANMSHELRTPLNSILGFSEVLYDQTFGPMNEKQKQYAENVLTSGRHLLSLINEVLDLAKVEAGKMKLELGEVSLQKVVEESVILVKEAAFKKNLGIKIEVPAETGNVLLDERKVRQVLCNLLFNSVKFTPSGGNLGVRIQFNVGRIDGAVWDSGIGIEKENLEKIFEAFSRIESPYTQETEGTGLGLALCRKMVELHGGRIWAESSGLGMGTTVKFFLPVNNAGKQT